MEKEHKELLLKDLCARLPYGVIVEDRNGTHELTIGNTELVDLLNGNCHIKPYLRPMSSMTEEERKEFIDAVTWETNGKFYIDECEDITFYQEKYDWLNAHHFDYRGLIPKGLAIEVTEEKKELKEPELCNDNKQKTISAWVGNGLGKPYVRAIPIKGDPEELCGCWSLAALLSLIKDKCGYFEFVYLKRTCDCRANPLEDVYRLSTDVYDVYNKEAIDACYAMIIKLHELNLL